MATPRFVSRISSCLKLYQIPSISRPLSVGVRSYAEYDDGDGGGQVNDKFAIYLIAEELLKAIRGHNTWCDDGGGLLGHVNSKLLEDKAVKHRSHLSFLVQEEVSRKYQLPLAVKAGGPLISQEDKQNFNPEEVWVLSKKYKSWHPPDIDTGVISSKMFKSLERLIDLATKNIILGEKKTQDTNIARLREVNDMVVEIMQGVDMNWIERLLKNRIETQFKWLYDELGQAIEEGWSNGTGRNALFFFLAAAHDVCKDYMSELAQNGKVQHNFIYMRLQNIGSGQNNYANCKLAIRQVDNAIMKEGFKSRAIALRQLSEWKLWEEEDRFNGWRFTQQIPDVFLKVHLMSSKVDLETPIGLLVAEIKSAYDSSNDDNQVFTQALKGLLYGSQTAGVLVHPEEATFIHISVEDGFINTKKKTYDLIYSPTYNSGGVYGKKLVNHEGYSELFKDLVLYLWNTYYQCQYSSEM